jgi:hypothetical protein
MAFTFFAQKIGQKAEEQGMLVGVSDEGGREGGRKRGK